MQYSCCFECFSWWKWEAILRLYYERFHLRNCLLECVIVFFVGKQSEKLTLKEPFVLVYLAVNLALPPAWFVPLLVLTKQVWLRLKVSQLVVLNFKVHLPNRKWETWILSFLLASYRILKYWHTLEILWG